MGMNLQGRWALVTGASSGIGRAIAEELAARGCHLCLVARREERLRAAAAEIKERHSVDTLVIAMDLSQQAAPADLAERLGGRPISVLVNNAGFSITGPLAGNEVTELGKMIDLNVKFPTAFTRIILPRLLELPEGGAILNVGSVTGYQGVVNMAAYAATKAFVNNFSEGLNWELRGSRVTVSCLQPAQTASEFFQVAGCSEAKMANTGLSTPQQVARAGIALLVRGKPKTVVGMINKIKVFGLRLSPRWLVRVVITRLFADMA